ncbi:unnamed protein product [Darwinula stevensoni]|uniref:Uncharacterized protein n=1 Tax=Darwinula stevensoni TaxID=69355 RepID=A0A7R9FNL6_9CRUS|nr:unnamed protein product [Darwinula stevensoni]CAG0896832.1 unnamed protein product [Darwinula stevensoni]
MGGHNNRNSPMVIPTRGTTEATVASVRTGTNAVRVRELDDGYVFSPSPRTTTTPLMTVAQVPSFQSATLEGKKALSVDLQWPVLVGWENI